MFKDKKQEKWMLNLMICLRQEDYMVAIYIQLFYENYIS